MRKPSGTTRRLTGAHSRQVHLHQRLLDAGLPPAVAFDDRGFEDRALEFRHPELEPARLCRERAFVVAGPVRLAPLLAFVSGGPGDLVGLGVEHGVDGLLDLDSNQSIELGLEGSARKVAHFGSWPSMER